MTGVDCLRNSAMCVNGGRALLRRDLPTMANLFADAGYRTGMFGKWHLGDIYPYRPMDRGFEESLCFRSSHIGGAPDAWNNDYFNDRYWLNGELRPFNGYCTDVFFGAAIQWVRHCAKQHEPFFLYLPTNAAHAPLLVPTAYRERAEGMLAGQKLTPEYRDALSRFFGMILNIDDNWDRLEKTLVELGLRENTIVIYMTDNGGTVGVPFYNAGMRGQKIDLWEGGHRVPCFIRWPAGGIVGGRDRRELAEVQDILPTLVDWCELKKPVGAKFDGTSLVPLLRGEKNSLSDRMLVVQYNRMDTGHPPVQYDAAVLWKRWRWIGNKELYDLSVDPHQDRNVMGEHPDVAGRMREHYERWWAEVEPTLRTFQPSTIGSDKENPTTLCATEWADVFLDQNIQVREGLRRNGRWHIEAEETGTYRFELRRWPRDTGLGLCEAAPAHVGEEITYAAGVALPIAKARICVAGQEMVKDVGPADHAAAFTVDLPKGRTTLETWFLDKDGREICGAYYVEVTRVR
jgi:arylsulfatase